jgi:heme/copper-type cytochrome/quinol oxidase subunit 2
MNQRKRRTRKLRWQSVASFVLALTGALLLVNVAAACPTCKDNLAHDPASAHLARGFYYSILFMVSMPFIIFGSLSAYFYWEFRRAAARAAAAPTPAAPAGPELVL